MNSAVGKMVGAMALSGTIGLFVLSSGQPPLTVVFARCLIGGMALLAWLWWQGGWCKLSGRAVGWLLLGAVALILNWLCLFSAYPMSSISVTTVVYHVQPFFLILLAALVQRELPGWTRLAWLALAFVGVALASDVRMGAQSGVMLQGVLLTLLAAFLYAVATLATRKLNGVPPAQIAGLQLLFGVVVLAPFLDLSAGWNGWQSWSSLLILGLVHTGLMYNLMYSAFQRLSASAVASLSFIYPVVAMLADYLFFQTTLSATQLLGIGLIVTALVANQRNWNFKLGARNDATT